MPGWKGCDYKLTALADLNLKRCKYHIKLHSALNTNLCFILENQNVHIPLSYQLYSKKNFTLKALKII